MVAHCLFEQSGTFKNEFKKLGIKAYDYDILNDYGETDFQIDLYTEIENAYVGGGQKQYLIRFPLMIIYLRSFLVSDLKIRLCWLFADNLMAWKSGVFAVR